LGPEKTGPSPSLFRVGLLALLEGFGPRLAGWLLPGWVGVGVLSRRRGRGLPNRPHVPSCSLLLTASCLPVLFAGGRGGGGGAGVGVWGAWWGCVSGCRGVFVNWIADASI
jgi:hypothetical protein